MATAAGDLLARCTFPPPSPVDCAFSGGSDSTALVALARAAGCHVTAIHVDHRLRPSSGAEAVRAASLAAALGVEFRVIDVDVADGPNLEARARQARLRALPPGHLTGHTADDQAETLLINLLRGAGIDGLAGIAPSPTKPLLGLRRVETHDLCRRLGLVPVDDPTNADRRFVRNRVRSELLPLLDDIAGRDTATVLARAAAVLREDADLLARVVGGVDPTDARALAAADPAIARRALRTWLSASGYPPDRAAVERAFAVAVGERKACEISGGRRVERSGGRLRIIGPAQIASPDGDGDVV